MLIINTYYRGEHLEFRRKLYKRGSSFETTIPMPLIFALDLTQKHEVIFQYDAKQQRWSLSFSPVKHPVKSVPKSGGRR